MKELDVAVMTAGAAIVVDRGGFIAGWNEGAEIVLGYAATDVVGRACHQVLCGRNPEGEPVCHPWCGSSSATRQDAPYDELVLYPLSAGREPLRVVLSVFCVAGNDPTRGWIVHSITAAEPLRARPHLVSSTRVASSLRRHLSKPKPPDAGQH